MRKTQVIKRLILPLLAAVMALSLFTCGSKTSAYMNGHRWGETPNETRTWDGKRPLCRYRVAPPYCYHRNGLSEFQYSFDLVNKDADDVYRQVKRSLGRADDTYEDRYAPGYGFITRIFGSVRISVHCKNCKRLRTGRRGALCPCNSHGRKRQV
jgi:hypothetical protein